MIEETFTEQRRKEMIESTDDDFSVQTQEKRREVGAVNEDCVGAASKAPHGH